MNSKERRPGEATGKQRTENRQLQEDKQGIYYHNILDQRNQNTPQKTNIWTNLSQAVLTQITL